MEQVVGGDRVARVQGPRGAKRLAGVRGSVRTRRARAREADEDPRAAARGGWPHRALAPRRQDGPAPRTSRPASHASGTATRGDAPGNSEARRGFERPNRPIPFGERRRPSCRAPVRPVRPRRRTYPRSPSVSSASPSTKTCFWASAGEADHASDRGSARSNGEGASHRPCLRRDVAACVWQLNAIYRALTILSTVLNIFLTDAAHGRKQGHTRRNSGLRGITGGVG